MQPRRDFRCADRFRGRDGFTLVELLVVIGVIAILVGITLAPLENGAGKARRSAAVGSAHSIGFAMYAFAQDHEQTYPDARAPDAPADSRATGAMAAVRPLLAGGYITDPSIFYIPGSASTKYAGTAASAMNLMSSNNVSWDFAGNGGQGLSATHYQYLPLLWSSVAKGAEPALSHASSAHRAVTCVPGASDAFGTSGLAVFYINNSAAFIRSTISGGSSSVTIISGSKNPGGSPTTATVLKGGG